MQTREQRIERARKAGLATHAARRRASHPPGVPLRALRSEPRNAHVVEWFTEKQAMAELSCIPLERVEHMLRSGELPRLNGMIHRDAIDALLAAEVEKLAPPIPRLGSIPHGQVPS